MERNQRPGAPKAPKQRPETSATGQDGRPEDHPRVTRRAEVQVKTWLQEEDRICRIVQAISVVEW